MTPSVTFTSCAGDGRRVSTVGVRKEWEPWSSPRTKPKQSVARKVSLHLAKRQCPLLDAWISLRNSCKRPGNLGGAWDGAEVRGTEISNFCANEPLYWSKSTNRITSEEDYVGF